MTATVRSPRASRCTTVTVFARVVAPAEPPLSVASDQDVLVAGLGDGVEDAVGRDVDGGDLRERPVEPGAPDPAQAGDQHEQERDGGDGVAPDADGGARSGRAVSSSSSSSSSSSVGLVVQTQDRGRRGRRSAG